MDREVIWGKASAYLGRAPMLFALLLAAVVAFNIHAFFRFQTVAVYERSAAGWFYPLRARAATTLAEVSVKHGNRSISRGAHFYYVAQELLEGREVTMPRLSDEQLWPWRHIALIDPLILDGQLVSSARSRELRASSSSVLKPLALSADLARARPIYMFIDADTPPEIDVRIMRDARNRLFVLKKAATDRRDKLSR